METPPPIRWLLAGVIVVVLGLGSSVLLLAPTGEAHRAAGAPTSVAGADVLLLGDSIMFLGGQRAAPYLRSHGLDVHLDAVGGTSPVQMPNNVDWVARTRLLANRLHPRTAVLLFTGNYWRLTSLPADDSVCREWGTAVRAMVTALQDAGTQRVILGESVPGHWAIDPDVAFFCGATGVRGLGVELIDLGGVVGDPSSPRTRIESMPRCGGGSPVVLRTKDIHVTLDGAERIGERIASLLDPSVAPPPRDCAVAAAGELLGPDDPALNPRS